MLADRLQAGALNVNSVKTAAVCDEPMPGGSATDEQIEPASCDAVPRG